MPYFEEAMKMAKVPSIFVSILNDGEILFTRSIGLCDIERDHHATFSVNIQSQEASFSNLKYSNVVDAFIA